MNSSIQQLIQLNVELEGALRVILARESAEALSLANEKFEAFAKLFATLQADRPEKNSVETPETSAKTDSDEIVDSNEGVVIEETPEEIIVEPIVEADEEPECVVVDSDDEEPTPAEPVAAPAPAPHHGDLLKSFTVNDKFLFIRELFDGSEADFRDTISLIASMQTFDEASEYLYDDLQLDPEVPQVVDFMKIIANYFK